jgi:MFS family permease
MTARAKPLWFVLAALTCANFFGYASRNALFSGYADLRLRWTVTESDIGLIGTAFMAGQALATLPFGWAGDRFRRQRVIMVGLLIAGVASVAGSIGPLAGRFDMLLLTRALVGVGTAAIVPVANSILNQLFDGPRKASKIAVFNVGLFLGGAAGFVGGGSPGYPIILLLTGAPMIAIALWVGALDIPAQLPLPGALDASPDTPATVATRRACAGYLVGDFHGVCCRRFGGVAQRLFSSLQIDVRSVGQYVDDLVHGRCPCGYHCRRAGR